jgi:hypothetical protein
MAKEKWPLFIQGLALLAHHGEKGVGDTVHRLIPGADAFKDWFEKQFGKSCGCTNRQTWLNAKFPYKPN